MIQFKPQQNRSFRGTEVRPPDFHAAFASFVAKMRRQGLAVQGGPTGIELRMAGRIFRCGTIREAEDLAESFILGEDLQ